MTLGLCVGLNLSGPAVAGENLDSIRRETAGFSSAGGWN